jgi:hypothetical protein
MVFGVRTELQAGQAVVVLNQEPRLRDLDQPDLLVLK